MGKKDKKKDKKNEKAKKAAKDKRSHKLKHKKKHAGSKDKKGAQGGNGRKKAKDSLKIQYCTCCKKHCPLTKPKCGKGRRLAAALGIRG